jgi:uncharacterized protein (DUF58 family)
LAVHSTLAQLWAKADRPAVRAFFVSIAALGVALLLALYSGAAVELGHFGFSIAAALSALAVAAWVGVTLVPVLAKRTPLRWIGYKMEYKVTREGWIYMAGIMLVALPALNTGNNLLFLILASLIAVILMSGVLSSITLSGVAMRLQLPEHIFAGQTVRARIELENEKLTLPSFSLKVEAVQPKNATAPAVVLSSPVYFPYLARKARAEQSVPLTFARRGVYRQESFRIVTRFPFGFLQKAHRLDLKAEAVVYPSVEPAQEFFEILPGLQGALESLNKGRGDELYALRDYVPTDSARHVHWKASARLGSLMVREFAREEDYRVLLVFDPHVGSNSSAARSAAAGTASGGNSAASNPGRKQEWKATGAVAGQENSSGLSATDAERFERAVNLCAGIAWHFLERNAELQFRSANIETPLGPASENIFAILRHLALAEPLPVDARHALLSDLAASPNLFKVIVTSQPRGSIPAQLWHSSYVVFLEDLVA